MTDQRRGPPTGRPLLGVVLCGGQSKRMGVDKANLITDDGITFLDLAHRRLQQICDGVIVSASADRDTQYPLVLDPPDAHGPVTGIVQSLRYAQQHRFTACLVNPVDTPQLTVADLSRLVDAFSNQPDRVACAVTPESPERLEPLIAIYPSTSLNVLSEATHQQQYSLQRILSGQSITRVMLSQAACHNVNTPADRKPTKQ